MRHDGFDMDSCDGGLCLRISHGSVACSAWRWTPAHERRGQNARSVREEVAAEFSCVLPPAVMSIVESADRALLETEESASAAAAMAISNHPSLRAAWREILSTYGTLKAADDVDDDATLIVTVERLDDEIQDDPYAAAPTGDVSVGPVGGGCGTEVAPLRVGRYHYGAKTPPKAALRILERDARVPTAELRDLGGLSACAAGDMPQLRALIAAGWPAPHAVDKFGSTALMWAASYGKVEVARLLIEEARCAVDARNKAGRTALMFACKYASQVCAVPAARSPRGCDSAHEGRFWRLRLGRLRGSSAYDGIDSRPPGRGHQWNEPIRVRGRAVGGRRWQRGHTALAP